MGATHRMMLRPHEESTSYGFRGHGPDRGCPPTFHPVRRFRPFRRWQQSIRPTTNNGAASVTTNRITRRRNGDSHAVAPRVIPHHVQSILRSRERERSENGSHYRSDDAERRTFGPAEERLDEGRNLAVVSLVNSVHHPLSDIAYRKDVAAPFKPSAASGTMANSQRYATPATTQIVR